MKEHGCWFPEKKLEKRKPPKALMYDNVGCTRCTKAGKVRAGRWIGIDKDECGLH